MSGGRHSFSRQTAEARRRALIDATILCLGRFGAAGLSVRNIAAEAGVSPGLLTHYFTGIDDLIAATYRDVAAKVGIVLEAAAAAAGDAPRQRLAAYLTASFTPQLSDAALFNGWVAFWGLIKTSQAMATAHRELYASYRAVVESHLAQCGMKPAKLRTAAIAATAIVDGLWLELCLDDSGFSAAEARKIVQDWVTATLDDESRETL